VQRLEERNRLHLWGPVAASGKGLDLLFVDYFRVANEKIVECEVVRDRLGMMIQLGAVPAK
jgi:hypothetical protein